jgi:dUTP pyrophosphatase
MTAKLALLPDVPSDFLPLKATLDSSGVDLRAHLDKPLSLLKGAGARVGTGVTVRIHPGHCCLIIPRSGLGGPPHFLTIPNAPGLIDEDYREEIFVNLFCLGSKVTINPGDRIAQIVCVQNTKIQGHFGVRTEQRTGGAGSTGVN